MNMLSPKKTKFRKQFKGRIHGNAKGNYSLTYGSYGLKAIEPERVTSRQIEAARKAITRYLKRAGRMWIRIFPDVPVSKKPAEVRSLLVVLIWLSKSSFISTKILLTFERDFFIPFKIFYIEL